MRANRQQVNGKVTTHRWESKPFPCTRWEVNDAATNDEGHCQLKQNVHFKCRNLNVSTIIISSHLLNTTHGSSKKMVSYINEEQFSSQKGKHSPLQQNTAKDLNTCATSSQNTTEPLSNGCTSVSSVSINKNGQQNCNIQKATCSNNKCAKYVLSMSNHWLPGNHLKDQTQITQSRSAISECGDHCNNSNCRKCLGACELSTSNQLLEFNVERRLPNYSKIEGKDKCLEVSSKGKNKWKTGPFQLKGTVCKKYADSRILSKAKDGIVCSTADQTNEDGSYIRVRPIDKQINSDNIQDSDNSDASLSGNLTVRPLQQTCDLSRGEMSRHSYKSGCGKHNYTSDILQSLPKEGIQWKRQNYQLATITLLEDKGPPAKTPECISLTDQQESGGAKSVATAMLLPAFRPYPFKEPFHRNKWTATFQNQAKSLQENNSMKMYHCTPHTPDEQSVQNIAEMAPPESHITIAQLLHTIREGMHQNQGIKNTIQINRLLKEIHRTKGMKRKPIKQALFLDL